MKIKISKGEKIFRVFNYMILTLITLICLYPMWHVVMGSLSTSSGLMSHSGLLLLPEGLSLAAYQSVLNNASIYSGYKNTFIILGVGIPLDLVMTCIGAYFFSRKRVFFRNPLMFLVLFTMYFSGGTIPFYLTLKDLHLNGSLLGIILPFMINTYNMIILRTAFNAIPDSLTEAAQIDGAGHFTILFRIVIPLAKATLAVMVLYYGVSRWNGWFWAGVLLRDREKYPLQIILREILLSNDMASMGGTGGGSDSEGILMSIKYATIIVATVPILLVYPLIQKHFTQGVMIGAVKE